LKINYLSETAITITLGKGIFSDIHQEVKQLYFFIVEQKISWIINVVPAYNSVSVFVSLEFYKHHASLKAYFENLYKVSVKAQSSKYLAQSHTHTIEVDYNGEDLEYVASYCKLTVEQVIDIHSKAEYTVAMIGFSPGFPYLLGLDERLIVPRRSTPRVKVAAGSLAIGGVQTGIYPMESPGGWHIIGSVSVQLFSVERNPPSVLKPGDLINFVRL
jgi:inhibitor of KinA